MRLSEYLSNKGISPSAFATTLGTAQATVSRYVAGKRFPRPEHLARIIEITNGAVTANDFLPPADVPRPTPSTHGEAA